MELIPAPRTDAYPITRFVSAGNQWEVGIKPVLYGFRVCGGLVGSGCYAFDYCAGSDRAFILQLFAVMVSILGCLPEETKEQQLQDMLPKWQVRPIDKDPCWDDLKTLYQQLKDGNRDCDRTEEEATGAGRILGE